MSEYLATVNFKYFNDFFTDITYPYVLKDKYIKFTNSSLLNLVIIKKINATSFGFEYIAGDSFRIDTIRNKIIGDKEHIAKINKLLETTNEFFYDVEKKLCIYDIQNKRALSYWSPFPPNARENEIFLVSYRDGADDKLGKAINKSNLFGLINFINRTYFSCIKPEKYDEAGLDFLWKLVCAYSNFPDTREKHINLKEFIKPQKKMELIEYDLCKNLYDLLTIKEPSDNDTITLTEIIEGGIPKKDAMDVIIDINLDGFSDLIKDAVISNGKLVFICRYNEPERFKKLTDVLIFNSSDIDFVVEDSKIDLNILEFDDDDDINYGGMY